MSAVQAPGSVVFCCDSPMTGHLREDTELQAERLSGPRGDVWRPVESENARPGPKTTENFKTKIRASGQAPGASD